MKTGWENDGQPNADGEYVAYIDMEDNSGVQRFIGTSHLEVSNQLLVAQGNATRKIREFTRTAAPEQTKPALVVERRDLTADERFDLSQNVSDPVKGPDIIKRVVEAELGAPLSVVRERLSAEEAQRQAAEARSQAEEFAAETPDYYVCDFNARALARYMQTQGYAPVKANFAKAFEEMKWAGLVVFKPSDETEEPITEPVPEGGELPAQPRVTTRPRGVVSSTGFRAVDSSTNGPTRTAKPKYTRVEIDAMSIEKYKALFDSDPEFRKACDALQ